MDPSYPQVEKVSEKKINSRDGPIKGQKQGRDEKTQEHYPRPTME